MRSMVEGARDQRCAQPRAPSTTPLCVAVPLPVPGRIKLSPRLPSQVAADVGEAGGDGFGGEAERSGDGGMVQALGQQIGDAVLLRSRHRLAIAPHAASRCLRLALPSAPSLRKCWAFSAGVSALARTSRR